MDNKRNEILNRIKKLEYHKKHNSTLRKRYDNCRIITKSFMISGTATFLYSLLTGDNGLLTFSLLPMASGYMSDKLLGSEMNDVRENLIHIDRRLERHYEMLKELSEYRKIPIYDKDQKSRYLADLK